MADFGNSAVFSQTDASNNTSTLPGIKGSDAPSRIDDAIRALAGANTRQWYWSNVTATSAGTGTGYTLAYSVSPAAYYTGQAFKWVAHTASTGSATININALGALTIKKNVRGVKSTIAAGEIGSGQVIEGYYDGTDYIWTNYSADPSVNALTAETVIALADFLRIYDLSATADRKITVQNVLKALNLLTEDTTPDTGADFVLTYDSSATDVKKAKPASLVPVGSVVAVSYNSTSAVSTTTTAIPYDDTIPQNTEGAEVLTVSHTPKSATNKLLISVVANLDSTSSTQVIAALFKDSDANALAATAAYISVSSLVVPIEYQMTAGTTSAITFKLRCGGAAGTTTINGSDSTRIFGGVAVTSISITEIKA